MNKVEKNKRKKYIVALISFCVVAVCVCVGVVMNLTTIYDQDFDNMGLKTFKMFTVLSNILCGVTSFLAIPYCIDSLSKHNYHLPKWIICLLHAGVTSVFLTFLISLCLLSPVKGFKLIFSGSRFFLHGLCPIVAITAFSLFIPTHRISIKETHLTLVPVAIYATVYILMVFVIGEEKGGWEDIYSFGKYVPFWIPAIIILPLTFSLATLVKLAHNASYEREKKIEIFYYTEDFKTKDIKECVIKMADYDNDSNIEGNIVIPRRLIKMMIERSGQKYEINELCKIYLDAYTDSRLIGNNPKKH